MIKTKTNCRIMTPEECLAIEKREKVKAIKLRKAGLNMLDIYKQVDLSMAKLQQLFAEERIPSKWRAEVDIDKQKAIARAFLFQGKNKSEIMREFDTSRHYIDKYIVDHYPHINWRINLETGAFAELGEHVKVKTITIDKLRKAASEFNAGKKDIKILAREHNISPRRLMRYILRYNNNELDGLFKIYEKYRKKH
jgi:hypothetical protein